VTREVLVQLVAVMNVPNVPAKAMGMTYGDTRRDAL